jgi:hypothetical protein
MRDANSYPNAKQNKFLIQIFLIRSAMIKEGIFTRQKANSNYASGGV